MFMRCTCTGFVVLVLVLYGSTWLWLGSRLQKVDRFSHIWLAGDVLEDLDEETLRPDKLTKVGQSHRPLKQNKPLRKQAICIDLMMIDTSREHWRCAFLMPFSDRLMWFMIESGFGHAIQLRDFVFDAALLSAFVERWWPKSHTFHLPWGECITLYRPPYGWGACRWLYAGFLDLLSATAMGFGRAVPWRTTNRARERAKGVIYYLYDMSTCETVAHSRRC
ncbi:hypothetical protein PIB30_019936 [Stylosanthes scabra]|uniref:Aminotransferase-like plant mobile domain-containing protein n=1 Tax=Stylosanthes scabra TaxID=79078 RepID=A0ABU6W8A6_9FABA|nr:hypothetical protein [Stylosanthes scabra]